MSSSVEPLTPVLQTSLSWENRLTTPPPFRAAPSPPVGRKVPRKAVPARNPATPELSAKRSTRSVDPLKVLSKGDPRYIQCMVCRQPALVTTAAELVCSHWAHTRCLQQHMSTFRETAKLTPPDKDVFPPCQICKYPAKPKDTKVSRTITMASRPLTPPPRTPRTQLPVSPRPVSVSSSVYSADGDFEIFDTKVPVRLSVTPVADSHSLGQLDQECQFLVSVSCPEPTYCTLPHVWTSQDILYSQKTTQRLSLQLNLPLSEIGGLRMERQVEFSTNGSNWVPAKLLLCEFIIVVVASNGVTLMLADIEQSLESIVLVTRHEVSMAIQFCFESVSQPPAYVTSGSRDQLFSLVAALNDTSLRYPLAQPNDAQLLLQSPFGSDFVHNPPCHTVICVPDSLPLGVISEAVGRMRTFEKIGIVRYGQEISSFGLARQSCPGWIERLAQPASFVAGTQTLDSVIGAAYELFDGSSSSLASRSIVFVCNNQTSSTVFGGELQEIPIYTVGLDRHNPTELSRISSQTCGSYISSPCEHLPQYIANLTFAERALTHENVEVIVKSSHNATISSVSGFGFAPGESSHLITESRQGTFTIRAGRLRAGQSQSFLVGAQIENHAFKYAVEDSRTELVEVAASATMIPGKTRMNDRSVARVRLDFATDAPSRCAHLKMHQSSPISISDNVFTLSDRIALSTALSLEVLTRHLEQGQLAQAAAVAQGIERGLETTLYERLSSIPADTYTGTEASMDAKLLVEVLLNEVRNIHVSIDEPDTRGIAYQINWLLRSHRAFSRRTNLESIYLDKSLTNDV